MVTSLIIIHLIYFATTISSECPSECECDIETHTVTCYGSALLTLPETVPPGFEVLVIRNASVRSIPKLAFRRMDRLKEIHFDSCNHLTFLEKFAFKGMRQLRMISFNNCPLLNEICKSTFSGIGNEFGVKIHFHRTPLHRIHSGAFRHASNIRELSISGSDLALSRHAFASITQLDFLTVSGVTVIEPQLFTNSTRFHIVHLKELNCDIPPRAFEDLAHVHQVLIQRSRISSLNTDAFSGLSTVETVELFNNQIGTIGARAFASIVNLGRIRIARNHIQTLQTVESLLSMAIQTRIEENTIECGCDLQWMISHEDKKLPDVNYCGAAGVHRTVRSFLRQQCSRKLTTATSLAPFLVTNHERHLSTAENSAGFILLCIYTVMPIIMNIILWQ